MLHKLLKAAKGRSSSRSAAKSAIEGCAIERMAAAYRQLVREGGQVDARSDPGAAACEVYLYAIDAAARAMGIRPTPRPYRKEFSVSYQAVFPDSGRHYRVDVLEASLSQDAAIWVNNVSFHFGAEVLVRAKMLQAAWVALGTQLSHLQVPCGSKAKVAQQALVLALEVFDEAWARFEHVYIKELIAIEDQARQPVLDVVEQERKLQFLEEGLGRGGDSQPMMNVPEYRQEQRRLVACMSRLNWLANGKVKDGRGLCPEVLESAHEVLQQCEAGGLGGRWAGSGAAEDACRAARVLAQDILKSYAAMRVYLRRVGACLERVDPHLCSNAGLVARLVDLQETWEVGTLYVSNPKMLHAVCDLVAEVRAVQRLAPALAAMCEDCDAELFLVLPRIIVLAFAADPTAKRTALLSSLLPHRFAGAGGDEPCPELASFVEEFRQTRQSLIRSQSGKEPAAAAEAAWAVIVRRAIEGANMGADAYKPFDSQAASHVESLMRSLEVWSLELQRRTPEDWNRFSAVLVECLEGGRRRPPSPKGFQV